MKIAYKVKSFVVVGKSSKEAYLKGCKKIASTIASNNNPNLAVQIRRKSFQAGSEAILEFTLLSCLDIKSEQKEFCKACKEFHHSFFINENYNCDRCNLKSFLKRVGERGKVSKSFYASKFKGMD